MCFQILVKPLDASVSQLQKSRPATKDLPSAAFQRPGSQPYYPVASQDYLVPVLNRVQRRTLFALVLLWSVTLVTFFAWWLRIEHVNGWFKFVLNTFLVLWTTAVPGYLLFFLLRMRKVNPRITLPSNWRVAMVTTRAPSEPFSIVQETLLGMLEQEVPHDTWLADEDPTEEIYAWCAEHGVQVSTRKGVSAYHRETWPRRTKCKEGNLAYFYDHYGYDNYDFVVQLDADHVPEANYLRHMLQPFVNDTVGYVSAPSICDKNAANSWSARGRLYAEAIMHGPLQAGHSNGFAPLCIGSHYAVRTMALKDIGGLGPELAEDHSTTLLMNAGGWQGIHALDAIAHGDGPSSFADCVVQEFQWSRSLMVLLLTLLPKCWRKLPWHLRIQFLFSELWYPLFSLVVAVGLTLPVIAIAIREPWVNVSYLDFLLRFTPLCLAAAAIQYFLRSLTLFRPSESPVFSWEGALFQLVRWPWSFYGSLMGVWTVIRGKQTAFRVTPKGSSENSALPWKVLAPYFGVMIISFFPAAFLPSAGRASGYYFFIILTLVSYAIATAALVVVHRREGVIDAEN